MTTGSNGISQSSFDDSDEELGVVVGIDGSASSHGALLLAAAEATFRGLTLTLLSTYSLSPWSDTALKAGHGMASESFLRQQSSDELHHAQDKYLSDHKGRIHHVVRFGDPTTVLVELSAHADLLVVGARGRGGFVGRLAGSVAIALPRYSECPVMIVPEHVAADVAVDHQPDFSSPVVVGVDGSERSLSALLLGAESATLRKVPLALVRVLPPVQRLVPWGPGSEHHEALVQQLNTELEGDRAWAVSHYPEVDIRVEGVSEGATVDQLTRHSEYAQVLYLGSKGRGGFAGWLLGSTADGMVQQARGPITVVPHWPDGRLAGRRDFPGGSNLHPAEE
ncbi:MAG TPA: universal stress protein [Candidatus Nesterenkonia stercoripullorum]|uniref:Universal stress protein n=1 Tax=Candidatus Nesterenkonia stercoripullorum TaxID=2838701 RepID=A0A9D1UUA4_9MICC|nr:universal stress protein [Candidatus Nesterenkonia stercoripullorum]